MSRQTGLPEGQDSHTPYNTEPPRPDRSYVILGAWAVGLLLVGIAFFRWAGSPAPPRSQDPRPLVPPTPIQQAPRANITNPQVPQPVADAIRRAREELYAKARTRISVVPHREASYRDETMEHLAGYVKNESDLTIRSWTATIVFKDAGGATVDEASKTSTVPIPPNTSQPFMIDHVHPAKAVHATMQLREVKFKE